MPEDYVASAHACQYCYAHQQSGAFAFGHSKNIFSHFDNVLMYVAKVAKYCNGHKFCVNLPIKLPPMSIIDSQNPDIARLSALLYEARNVVITCHLSPDGDALGSSLGLMHVLSHRGISCKVVTPDSPPQSLSFLPGVKDIVVLSRYEAQVRHLTQSADIIFCLDYNELNRVDRLAPYIAGSPAAKVMIDHHLHPSVEHMSVVLSYPEMSSTCSLLYMVLEALGLSDDIDKNAAECIYTGMMTDTGNFSYNSNDPRLYLIIASLLGKGIDKDLLYRQAMNVHSEDSIRLRSYALSQKMQVFHEYHAALITITRDEANAFNYRKGDTEGLVNVPLSIPGIVYSCYLRDEDDYVKVSMRSIGDFPVNKLCKEYFGGGGHLNAAGGEFHNGDIDACAELFRSLLAENMKLINN